MPVKLRDKRRSLHITHSKLTELTKDAMRPKSWYLSSNGGIDIDPYTSVRKIFYEFPKKAFYGDNNESNGEIISNGHANVEASPVHKENEKNLRESFLKLNVKTPPSPVPAHKNYDNNDNNNNVTHSSASKFKRSYFSSKQSESTSLKEESSSYADIYVPNATKTSNNFLRRGYKRRSLDPTKFKHLEDDDAYSISSARSSNSYLKKVFRRSYDPVKIQELMAESVVSDSVFSSNGDLSVKSRDITNPSEKSSILPEEQSETDNLIMERFLRDANVDICQGVYPTAEDSVIFEKENIIATLRLKNKDRFIPWNKRLSYIDTTKVLQDDLIYKRRDSKRYSSLRLPKNKNFQRRASSGYEATLQSRRSTPALRRHNSESCTIKKKMNSTLSLHREGSTLSQKDVPRSLRRRSSKMAAPGYFQGYEDKLREKMFTLDVKEDCNPSSSLFKLYEYILKAFDAKLLGNTYQQLFYIRSRLSASAQKNDFVCDGYFGCDCELTTTSPTWV